MWKLWVGFAVFAALALYILTKSGGNVDLGGEKHEVAPAADTATPDSKTPSPAASAAAATPAASK
jgi:hypothetical protein